MGLTTSHQPFKINRIHTPLGIFKVSGYRTSDNTVSMSLVLSDVSILSTDGWESLKLTQSNNCILERLHPHLVQHLISLSITS